MGGVQEGACRCGQRRCQAVICLIVGLHAVFSGGKGTAFFHLAMEKVTFFWGRGKNIWKEKITPSAFFRKKNFFFAKTHAGWGKVCDSLN